MQATPTRLRFRCFTRTRPLVSQSPAHALHSLSGSAFSQASLSPPARSPTSPLPTVICSQTTSCSRIRGGLETTRSSRWPSKVPSFKENRVYRLTKCLRASGLEDSARFFSAEIEGMVNSMLPNLWRKRSSGARRS